MEVKVTISPSPLSREFFLSACLKQPADIMSPEKTQRSKGKRILAVVNEVVLSQSLQNLPVHPVNVNPVVLAQPFLVHLFPEEYLL